MNKNLNARLPIAVSKNCELDLPSYHVTSGTWFQNIPVSYRHMIKGERYQAPIKFFTKLDPVSVPVFGRIRQNIRAFFVPYRLVFPNWSEYAVNTLAYQTLDNSITLNSGLPRFTSHTLWMMLDEFGCLEEQSDPYEDPATGYRNFDFSVNGVQYKLTTHGLRVVTLLESLGYCVIPTWGKDPIVYNALALLAMAKVWLDWYANGQYMDSEQVLQITTLLSKTQTFGYALNPTELSIVIEAMLFVGYDKDYFTSCFDNPAGPNVQMSSYTLFDPTTRQLNQDGVHTGMAVADQGLGETPVMAAQDSGNDYNFNGIEAFSDYALRSLEALSDMFKRYQIVGSRAADRWLALYGRSLPAEALKRSMYLGNHEHILAFGDVMSHADNSGPNDPSTLGDYAGQSAGGSECRFECSCDEHGIFLVLSSLIPDYDYYQGIDRHNLHMDRLDFLVDPSFDSLGCQAVYKGELYVSWSGNFAQEATDYLKPFGYLARYAEYKTSRSYATGKYRSHAHLAGGNAWHLFREFRDSDFRDRNIQNMVHSLSFTLGKFGLNHYNRIFNTEDNTDHFNMMFFTGGRAYSPCLSLFDSYKFDNDEGREITMSVGGKQLN